MATLSLEGQTLDTGILGSVLDPTGAAVAGAPLTIAQPVTGLVRQITTSPDGKYEVRYLVPGEYTVEVRAPGFRAERRTGIVIQIGQQARIDFALQVGDVVETVDVSSTASLLQTENAVLGEVVVPERIVNLPLNGRNFGLLAGLAPGVQVLEQVNGLRTRVIANGARDIAMQISFDGVSVVNNRENFVVFYPSIDAIEEFKVQTGNYSAEYGGNAGANINVQFKSGTNQLHGSVFEFVRNRVLDARGYFLPSSIPKDNLRRNQFGAVVTGPIRKDRTFFMLGYEGMRSTKQTASTGITLTPAQRHGDFSATSNAITDPLNGQPFPGNILPASRLNPVSVSLASYLPLPNQPGAVNFAGVTRDDINTDQALTRIDQYLGKRDQMFGHYLYARRDYPNYDFNPVFKADRTFPNQSVAIQHVHTFSPSLLNELRFGYQRGNQVTTTPRQNTSFTPDDIGIRGLRVDGPNGRPLMGREAGFPQIDIAGFVGMGDRNISTFALDFSRTFQFVDNLSIIRVNHAMKMGVDARYLLDDATTVNVPFGNLSFTSDISGNAAAAYMLGYPRTVLTPEGLPISAARQWRYAFYFQDDWKVTPKLTINLGARYDLLLVPKDINGNTRTLRFDLDPAGPVLWPQQGQVAELWKQEYWHIAPRVGFAYRLRSDTVIRGGYGIFTTAHQFNNLDILQLNPPIAGSVTITNNTVNPAATINSPMPAALFPNPIQFNAVSIEPDRKFRDGYLQNWNLQVAREITRNDVLEVGYVGSKGTSLDTSITNWNSPDPGPGAVQPRRPFPAFARIRMIVADGNSSYHALQARYEHRLSKGLSLTASYAWSHMIDDQGTSTNRGAAAAQDPRHRGRAERANSIFDIRQKLVVGYVWELPIVRSGGSGLGRALLAGWSANGIVTLQTGPPFNVTQSGDSQNVDPAAPRPNLVLGQQASFPASQRDPAAWFNTGAFSRSTLQYGNSPRNPLVAAGVKTFNLSASKAFKMPFKESHQLTFRAEFFNALNTPQFDLPASSLGTGTFGRVTGTAIDQRQIQLALKYTF